MSDVTTWVRRVVPGERPEGIDLSPVDSTTLEVTLEMPMGDGAGPGCLYWIGAM
ncbi:MAG: hypothetical protein OXG04_20885 [Acidobacteria bacterium]|nr:hypothetical protein [Acidobacteriota bacterium]